MNKIILTGNAGKDPEIATVKGDKKVAKFGLAVNEYSKNEKGENVQNTTWFNIVAWDKNAENIGKYLKKGGKILVEGRLVVREYTKDDGVKGKSVEVMMSNFELLGGKQDSESTDTAEAPKKETAKSSTKKTAEPEVAEIQADSSDDLPF